MKLKLNDANIEVDKAEKVARLTSMELDKKARPGTIVRNIYDKSLRYDAEKHWKEKKRKIQDKVRFIKGKRKHDQKESVPDIYMGVKVSDEVLTEDVNIEVRIYNGVETSENEVEALKIPPDDSRGQYMT